MKSYFYGPCLVKEVEDELVSRTYLLPVVIGRWCFSPDLLCVVGAAAASDKGAFIDCFGWCFEYSSAVSDGDGGYDRGGETQLNGVETNAPRSDVLGAAALGVPIGKTNGLTLTYFTSRTQRDVGGEFESLVLGWSMRF